MTLQCCIRFTCKAITGINAFLSTITYCLNYTNLRTVLFLARAAMIPCLWLGPSSIDTSQLRYLSELKSKDFMFLIFFVSPERGIFSKCSILVLAAVTALVAVLHVFFVFLFIFVLLLLYQCGRSGSSVNFYKSSYNPHWIWTVTPSHLEPSHDTVLHGATSCNIVTLCYRVWLDVT